MTAPTPIPVAESLVIPWPTARPLNVTISASDVHEAWETLIEPLAAEGPQSGELRCLMGVIRAVYDGMHGLTGVDVNGDPLAEFDPDFDALYSALFTATKSPANVSLTTLCRTLFAAGVRVTGARA